MVRVRAVGLVLQRSGARAQTSCSSGTRAAADEEHVTSEAAEEQTLVAAGREPGDHQTEQEEQQGAREVRMWQGIVATLNITRAN